MATLLDLGNLANPGTVDGAAFALRFSAAMYAAAHAIINESPTTPERQQWAKSVVEGGTASPEVGRFVRYALGNPTVQSAGAAVTDNDIQFIVNSLVTELIGA